VRYYTNIQRPIKCAWMIVKVFAEYVY